MCICINCRYVSNCTIYQIIQKQHKQKNHFSEFMFTPNDTLINININLSDNLTKLDWDLIECLSFIEDPGKWLKNH